MGFFDACNDPQDEREELSLVEYPEYREEWQRVKDGEKDSYLYNTVQTYVDASNGIIITETEYPPEWLNGDGGKASKEPAAGERVEQSDAKACSGTDSHRDIWDAHSDS